MQFLHESDVTLHLQLVHNSSKPKEQVKVPGLEPTINKSKKDCQNCDQKFSSDFQLKIHDKLGNGKPMKCSKCPFKACTARGFDIHEKKCKGITENTGNNEIQKQPEDTEIPKKCKHKQCRHTFNSVEELEIHEKNCLRNRIVEIFSSPNEPKKANIPCAEPAMIPNGFQIIKNKELEKSMTSNEKFNDSVPRNKEFIESLARKRNNCPDCDQDFHRHKDLQEHINTKEKLSHCTQCSFKSCNSLGMKNHIVESHNSSLDLKRCNDETSGNKKRQFKCGNCDQIFFNKSDLEVHLKTKDKLAKCSQCFLSLAQTSD